MLPKSVYSQGNLTTTYFPPLEVVIVDIADTAKVLSRVAAIDGLYAGAVKVLSRVDAIDGLYVAVGNETVLVPKLYFAVTFFAAYGSVGADQVYAITGDTATRQSAAINTNANVTFFIQTPLFTKISTLMGDICFLLVIGGRARENYFQTIHSRQCGDFSIEGRKLQSNMFRM
jgi:hypothetical protein